MLGINNNARLLGSHVYSHTLALYREVKLGARESEEEEGVMVAGRGHDSLDIIPSHPPHPGRSQRGRPAEPGG
jgi:hypothetical protein